MAERLKIYKETDKAFSVRVQTAEGLPVRLSGASEIKVVFLNEYNCSDRYTVVTLTGGQVVVSSQYPNKMRVTLTDQQTKNFRAGEDLSFEVVIKIGTTESIVQFIEKLDVVERIFPGS